MSFIDMVKEFFRWTNNRESEPFLGWQHLLTVAIFLGVAIFLAIYFGRKYRHSEKNKKLKVLKVAAILMISLEVIKIVVISIRNKDALSILSMLPLFLCSMHLFSIPLAAFAKGKVQDAALTFLYIFGIVSCLGGTVLASNYFGSSPILSFDLLISVTTHTISGFASLYTIIVNLVEIKKGNILGCAIVLLAFELLAFGANQANAYINETMGKCYESNYMFLSRSAGTPFEICNTIVGGNQVLYTLFIALIYFAWMGLFLGGYYIVKAICNSAKKRKAAKESK
ncbi:MAG: YwaF family protein [Clostridia bacterium]|nr:YwaF family protein [Clostridia bacterium]